jgi:hypothetical protein
MDRVGHELLRLKENYRPPSIRRAPAASMIIILMLAAVTFYELEY